jgi:hypothetical protein
VQQACDQRLIGKSLLERTLLDRFQILGRNLNLQAGRLGIIKVDGSSIILGEPLKFTKENIDAFDF